jgi:folylpolyglutamate synthase/dihydropteroate synthase
VNDAIQQFTEKANEEDLILVCGSIFVVGEVDRKRFLTN